MGKSTFFNLLSKLNVPAENFPFCTIDPNVCRVPVPVRRTGATRLPSRVTVARAAAPCGSASQDKRFDHLVSVFEPKSVYASGGRCGGGLGGGLRGVGHRDTAVTPRAQRARGADGDGHCGSSARCFRGRGPGQRIPVAHLRRGRHLPHGARVPVQEGHPRRGCVRGVSGPDRAGCAGPPRPRRRLGGPRA